MTENKAIELLRIMQNPKQDYADVVCAPAFCTGFRFVYPEPEDYAIEEAIKALKEIQQYREIGTVEECREAIEKQKAKKPLLVSKKKKKIMEGDYVHVICPSCEEEIFSCFLFYPWNDSQRTNKFCKNCGQAILWDENLEEMEDGA